MLFSTSVKHLILSTKDIWSNRLDKLFNLVILNLNNHFTKNCIDVYLNKNNNFIDTIIDK